MSLGKELLPTGFREGEFFPQEFRRGSSSHRSSDRGVLVTVVQAGKLSPQEIMQGSSYLRGPDIGVSSLGVSIGIRKRVILHRISCGRVLLIGD
jgi:hypothetical protein